MVSKEFLLNLKESLPIIRKATEDKIRKQLETGNCEIGDYANAHETLKRSENIETELNKLLKETEGETDARKN